jgi:hypothetical protein
MKKKDGEQDRANGVRAISILLTVSLEAVGTPKEEDRSGNAGCGRRIREIASTRRLVCR